MQTGNTLSAAIMRLVRLYLVIAALILPSALATQAQQVSNVTIRVATYGGTAGDAERLYVGDRFTRTTGIKVEYVTGIPGDSMGKLLAAKGREAPFDVVILDDTFQHNAILAGVIAKLDPKLVPNLALLYPEALSKEGYGPAFDFYSVGIVYNKKKLKEAGIDEPTSWNDLWNPKLAGRIAVPDISLAQGTGFAVKIAELNGGSASNLIPGLKKIAELQAHDYYVASNVLEQELLGGDVWISVWTSGRAWALIRKASDFGYAIANEGSILGLDTIDMVAGTPHPKEAQMYIDMHLDSLSQLGRAVETSYGPVTKTLTSVFSSYPALAQTMPSSSADLTKLERVDVAAYNAHLKEAVQFWNRNVKH